MQSCVQHLSKNSLLVALIRPQVTITRWLAMNADPFDGYTRSKHITKKFVNVEQPDGSFNQVPSCLIDNTNEWIGDQMTKYHLKMTMERDWTMAGFAERARKRLLASHRQRQMISAQMIQHLGLNLAVATMVVNLGGRVQFEGIDRWFQRYNGGPSELPTKFVGDLHLETIDLSGTAVMYPGFLAFSDLQHLRILRLRRCSYVDDHCLSLVGQITNSPLDLLDVSECRRLTANGLTTLTQLKNLRRLIVQGNSQLENDLELVCLLLEDYLPRVYVEGVDYLGSLPEASRQRILALSASDYPSLPSCSSSSEEPAKKVPLSSEEERQTFSSTKPYATLSLDQHPESVSEELNSDSFSANRRLVN